MLQFFLNLQRNALQVLVQTKKYLWVTTMAIIEKIITYLVRKTSLSCFSGLSPDFQNINL